MGDHVKGLAEVQDHHISMDSGIIGSEEVMHGGEQLGKWYLHTISVFCLECCPVHML